MLFSFSLHSCRDLKISIIDFRYICMCKIDVAYGVKQVFQNENKNRNAQIKWRFLEHNAKTDFDQHTEISK